MGLRSMRRTRLRLVAIVGAAAALLVAALMTAVSAQAAQGCRVEYAVSAEWQGGFTANVEVTNLGDAIDGWELKWAFPSGQRITQAWNTDVTASGANVTAEHLSYNRSLGTDSSVSFGFNGSWSGSNASPTSFTLGGTVCDGPVGEPTPTTPPPTGSLTAMEQVAAMQPGWNVGNSLDALGGETAWGNPMITEELLDTVRAEGFNSIRIPVTWDEHLGPAPEYTIDPARLDRVAEVVDWALEDGFHVMLNLHHDSWMWIDDMPADHDGVLAKYEAIWTQLADRFKDHPDRLVFESVNEPLFANIEDAVADALVGTFQRVNDTFVDNGIPVIIGEYGLLGLDHLRPGIIQAGETLKFFEALGYQARANEVTTMLWDAGSFLNRGTLQWRMPELSAQIESSWTARSGTASSDQVYLPKTGTIPAETLTLNPNGTAFQGLWQGNTQLTQGVDYTVSGNTLTLTTAALTRLAGDRAYGVNSTIEARFSTGVPWRISIITADPAVLAGATGSTGSFAIPTQFRGDQLATMEAAYADGTNAGPHDWTSYKEFWTAFQPDYSAGAILLKQAFFDEVGDGRLVILTFHFRSGTTVTYEITKTGTTVTA